MPNNTELFINPEAIRAIASQISSISKRMKANLDQVKSEIDSTENTYVAESATEMRDQFNAIKPYMDQFISYLSKVSVYLVQNVADPADLVDQVARQNVASIKKPQ